MPSVWVDGHEVEIGEDERLNGIQVAARAGKEVPHYCWHAGLTVVASCRMCLVETGTRDATTGDISMAPKLVPACQTPANDGAVFITESEKVAKARAQVEEGLLIRHPIDCPICDKAGECRLQDYHFEHGQAERRADVQPFTSRRRELGETVTLFVDRCVMCSRCVRFSREISGSSELMVINRGAHEEIDVFPGFPLQNKLSGNVVDLCPVGALGDRDFLYQQRVWFMKRHAGVCAGCSTGCSIWTEENQDRVYRIKPRENPSVNEWWICDEGRYGFHHVHDPNRICSPFARDGAEKAMLDWDDVMARVADAFSVSKQPALVLSPMITVEDAYLAAKWAQRTNPNTALILGHVPLVGKDEVYPRGFTIRAEKCPNRRGVEEVIRHFSGEVTPFESFVERAANSEFDVAFIVGGYKKDWIADDAAQRIGKVESLIVQDLFESSLAAEAAIVLPATTFAEKSGSYVNALGHIQFADWAIRPPDGCRAEASLFSRLLGEVGMYRASDTLSELASEIPYFAAVQDGIPALGVNLEAKTVTKLAASAAD